MKLVETMVALPREKSKRMHKYPEHSSYLLGSKQITHGVEKITIREIGMNKIVCV